MEYHTVGVLLRTLRCRLLGRADLARWRDAETFDGGWEQRTRLIAGLVPRASRVIEFGAGRRLLEAHLDASCTYVPSDLVARGPDTIVLDLNARPLPQLSALKLDVAVLAGVLEYIAEPASFITWLAQQVPTCITSYSCAATKSRSLGRLRETIRRTGAGWVNTFNEDELVGAFRSGGFELSHTADWHTPEGSERIFVFHSRSPARRLTP